MRQITIVKNKKKTLTGPNLPEIFRRTLSASYTPYVHYQICFVMLPWLHFLININEEPRIFSTNLMTH